MWIPAVAGVTAATSIAAGLYVRRKRAKRREEAAALAAAQAAAQPAVEEVGQPQGGAALNLPGALKDLKGLSGGGVLGTIGAGLAAANAAGQLVEALGAGKGKGNLVRVGGVGLALPVLADVGAQRALEVVGIDDPDAKKTAGQLAAAGAIGGITGGIIPIAGVKLLDAGLGLVSKDAQEAVHDVFRPLDPTNPNSAAGKVVGGIGDAVAGGLGGIAKAVGGLFGGSSPSTEERAQLEAARQAAEAAIQTGVVKVEQVAQVVQAGGLAGLLNAGKALAAQAQLPVFAPAVVPIEPPAPPLVPDNSPTVKLPALKLGRAVNLIKFGGGEL